MSTQTLHMKTAIEIKAEIRKREGSLISMKDKYSRMHPIDIQSGDGNQMRSEMNKELGFIEGLNWILQDE